MSTGLKVGLVGTLLRDEHLGLLPPNPDLLLEVVWAAKHFLIISVSFSFFGFSLLAVFRGC